MTDGADAIAAPSSLMIPSLRRRKTLQAMEFWRATFGTVSMPWYAREMEGVKRSAIVTMFSPTVTLRKE